MSVNPEGLLGDIEKLMFCIIECKLKNCISIFIFQSNMPYNLTPSPACYPFKIYSQPAKILYRSWRYDNYVTQTDKQSHSLADVNVSAPKARVRSGDFSMFCIEKCKHLEGKVSSKATTMEMYIFLFASLSAPTLNVCEK